MAKLIKALWLYIASFIAVAAIYYLFTGVEQGIDVVIQSGEVLTSAVFTVVAVFLWAFTLWYSSRLLSYIKQQKAEELYSKKAADDIASAGLYRKYAISTKFHKHIPRLLAYNCFVSVTAAIYHLPTIFNCKGWCMLGLLVAFNIFYFLLSAWFENDATVKTKKVLTLVNSIILTGYVTFMTYWSFCYKREIDIYTSNLRHKFWLMLIAMMMFGLQTLCLYIFVQRRKHINARKDNPSLKQSFTLTLLRFNPEYNAAEAPYFKWFNGITAIAVLFYVGAIVNMKLADSLGPMSFALLAFGILAGGASFLTQLSIRWSFNVFILVYGMAIVFGQFRDPYQVRVLRNESGKYFSARPDTRTYLKKWFNKRAAILDADTTKKFPIYIVLSNGGASRAAQWTSGVLGGLQDMSYTKSPNNSFKDHILCIAGASGGTVGNCAFYGLLKAEHDKQIQGNEFKKHSDALFATDFLTFTLARFLGPDMLRHIIPFNIPMQDRAAALEDVLANGSDDEILNRYLNKPVTQVFDTTGALPVLYINTTQVDNGMPGVVSSIRLPKKTLRTDVLRLLDSVAVDGQKGADIRFSTAAILSSRFPYVSPAGKVLNRYYVDGGYFDNSGAGTVLEFIQELNAFWTDPISIDVRKYRDRFTFHILHVTNSEIFSKPSGDIHPLTNDLLAPLLTLAGMQGSSTSIGNGVLKNNFSQLSGSDTTNAFIQYSLYDELRSDSLIKAKNYEEGYPMSWVISEYQRQRMRVALDSANRRNIYKFEFGK